MKQYFRSKYIKKNTLSPEINKRLEDDLRLFSSMWLNAFTISNKGLDKTMKDSPHVFLKSKYDANDYFVTAAQRRARMTTQSQKELLTMYIADTEEDISDLADKKKELEDRLKSLKAMKQSLIKYTKTGQKKLSMIKNFKSSGLSFKPDGSVTVGNGKYQTVYPNIWLFEHKYLDHKIRQMKSAVDSVKKKLRRKKDKLAKLKEQTKTGCYSIYFGSRELMHKDIPQAQKDKLIWKKRNGSMTLAGRNDAPGGNYMVAYDPDTHLLQYRGSAGPHRIKGVKPEEYYEPVAVVEFPYGQELLDRSIRENKTPVAWIITDCGNAWRFDACITPSEERMNDYYGDGCIAMDVNWDRIAVAELNGTGGLIGRKVLPFQMEHRSSEQIEQEISKVLEQVFMICREKNKPLVAEDISNTKRKAGLYSKTTKRNRRVSLFANDILRRLTESKSSKYSIHVTFVNPAYTSQTGKVKYMHRYGLSVHESAAYVIGRRGLGIIDKLPEEYAKKLTAKNRQLSRMKQWAKAYRYTKEVKPSDIFKPVLTGNEPNVYPEDALPF